MMHRIVFILVLMSGLQVFGFSSIFAEENAEVFFETNIRPVLIESCFECHGQAEEANNLRVDSLEALLSGGDSGPAMIPGHADASLLIKAIRNTHEDFQMPPERPLSQRVVGDFEKWINAGAAWPKFNPVTIRRRTVKSARAFLDPSDKTVRSALQLWFKANDQPWQDGQKIYLWQDSSGRGHDLAATAGARAEGTGQPAIFIAQSRLHGFPAVHFDMSTGLGGNAASAPEISGDAEFTMFVVAKIDHVSTDSDGLIAGFGEPAHAGNPGMARCAILGVQAAGGKPVFVGGWGNDASLSESKDLRGSPVIMTLMKHQGPLESTSRIFVNAMETPPLSGNGVVPDFGRRGDIGFFMGHARSWLRGFEGDVGEVILYNRALTSAERSGIEQYLSGKFRIPISSGEEESLAKTGDPAFQMESWAFQTISPQPIPDQIAESIHHPVDRFVTQGWQEKSLEPVDLADARTLIRRLYFDLHGLPPTPEELNAARDALTPWSDAAWGELIDKLLGSPRYGERWGRHWLDVARYADTAGDNADYPIPEAHLYRDYVIDAFNNDKPYDEFVCEQIAGDLYADEGPPERYAEQVTATGFLALSRRYATGPYELWHLTLEDTIDTVGQAFMGLTMRCARCHDHKFDPISQQDYYALYGIFESTQFPWGGAEEFHSQKRPRVHFVSLLPPAEATPRLHAHEEASRTVDTASEEIRTQYRKSQLQGYPADVPSAYAVTEGVPRPSLLQLSGDPGNPGPIIARGVPKFLDKMSLPDVPPDQSGRRQLAEWLTDPQHPLTSRVLVNRVWQHHFGRGIVATPSNFGARGAKPTHPELLDWLARRFMTDGWSIKQLHRLILTSEVWRLSSAHKEQNATIDPANKFLWRHARRRLDAESIRDSMLAISGRLDLNRPGAHPFPPINSWTYTQHNQFRDFYPSSHRSVYLMTTRLQRHPFLALFDGPDTNTTTDLRRSSTVPVQALYLMNSVEIKTEAETFARRILVIPSEFRIDRLYELAFQRSPTPDERDRAQEFITKFTVHSNELTAWTAYCRSILISHEAFYID